MQEDAYIADAVEIAKDKAQYDAAVKGILSDRNVLAWILSKTVMELEGVPIEVIKDCIEGEPEVSRVYVDPGRSNQTVINEDTEDKVPYEGAVRFDIRFCVITPDRQRIRLIINVEAQKKFYPGYDLVTRGIYYAARMISSQKEKEFSGNNYDDIKKVYSIWICMNTPKYVQNTITEYRIQQHKLYGNYRGKARYDLMSVVMLCLGNPEDNDYMNNEYQKLLRLLAVLSSPEIAPNGKLKVLEEEYHIAATREMEEDVNYMCNWSEGVIEWAIEKAEKIVEERTQKIAEEAQRKAEEESQRKAEEAQRKAVEEAQKIAEEATRKEAAKALVQSVENLMDSLNISAEKACELLKTEWQDYTAAKEKIL